MECRLEIPPAPIAQVRALERALGVSFATAQVLVRRGLGDESAARAHAFNIDAPPSAW